MTAQTVISMLALKKTVSVENLGFFDSAEQLYLCMMCKS